MLSSSVKQSATYEALYLHIPFCKQRCTCCDFETEALPQNDEALDVYRDELIRAIRAATRAGDLAHIRTLYIGGGTPTHFGHARLVELCYTLSLSINLEQVEEYTVEANPESLTPALVRDLYALGVGRLSMGVQSFVDTELATLGRIHNSDRAREAYAEARERFDNVSIDLMCGIPGQTAESWQYSLDQALRLEPEHISVYALQREEGTPLTLALESGALHAAGEDEQADMLQQAAAVLVAAGYKRYEVASYAKPGRESKHNTCYWTGVSYLGLGRGAASMKNREDGSRERWDNQGRNLPEILSAREARAEDLLLAMRMSNGVSEELLVQACSLLPEAQTVLEDLCQLGMVEHVQNQYRPTEKGWLLGNEIYGRLWNLSS